MTYGLGIIGVSDSMLRDVGRVAAAMVALASGAGGQNLDAALIIADGGPSGMAYPAFDAHLLPIGEWATAVWEERLPYESLQGMIAEGKRQLEKPRHRWAGCRGPGIALVGTCHTLKRVVQDAVTIVTDDGKVSQLQVGSFAAVGNQVKMALRRWCWRNLEKTMPRFAKGGSGNSALMAPLWNLLK